MTKPALFIENIPSYKFVPPQCATEPPLLRTGLLTRQLREALAAGKTIVIEAQAGQGKTILASQFLNYHQLDHLWYQIGPEDENPLFVLSAISFSLKQKYPSLTWTRFDATHSKEHLCQEAIQRWANTLLDDIDAQLNRKLYIVFDDIHLSADYPLTNYLLDYLLDATPSKLQFLLLSRIPLHLKSKILTASSSICHLTTDDLALSSREIATYFGSVLAKEIDPKEAEEIHRISGGWITGIILANQKSDIHEQHHGTAGPSASTLLFREKRINDFFRNVLDQIPEHLHVPLLRLSLLTEIPIDLARIVSNREDIEAILCTMATRNLFVYQPEKEFQTYSLHPLLQQFLQRQAEATLSTEDSNAIQTSEAEYYLKRGMIDKAFSCLLRTQNYARIDAVLKESGPHVLGDNPTVHTFSSLCSIPEATILHHRWIAFYAGCSRLNVSPCSSLPYFEAAQVGFVKAEEEDGELLSLAMIVFFHAIISGKYKDGAFLLPRLEDLLLRNASKLPASMKTMGARCLALGLFLFSGETEKARSILSKIGSRQEEKPSQTFIAGGRCVHGYIELYAGNITSFCREAESCFALRNDPRVDMLGNATFRILLLCHLSMHGDHLGFSAEQQAIRQLVTADVLDGTTAALDMHIWESCNFFSCGKTAEAMELLSQGPAFASPVLSPHMQSQILQWKAFGHALQGENSEARHCIDLSVQLRNEAGGALHQAFNSIIAGTVYSRLNLTEPAESYFEQGLKQAKAIPSPYFLACGYLNRSYHKLVTQGPESASDDLRTALVLMRLRHLEHLWTFEPKMMFSLLSHAVKNDIEKDFACRLARKYLDISFTGTGEAIHLLHFTLLDNFRISCRNQKLFQAHDFSPSQRELLGILLATKGQQISQERVQLAIWPDSPPTNARTSFDTLLNRLRQKVSPALQSSAKKYIVLQKGILELAHSETDALVFIATVRNGLRHAKIKQWWQADNAFRYAFSLLKGLWPEDTFCNEYAITLNDQIITILTEATITWASILARFGDTADAIRLLERTLQIYFYEERLISLLHFFYIKNNNHLKAADILERYKEALKRHEYTDEEVIELQEEIISFSLKKLDDERRRKRCD